MSIILEKLLSQDNEFKDLADHIVSNFITFTQAHFIKVRELPPDTILVTDQYPDDPEASEKRPRVVVQRGTILSQDTSLHDDMLTIDIPQGVEESLVLSNAALTLLCMSQVGLEAEAIGFDLKGAIYSGKREICARTNIHTINSVSVGPERAWEIKGRVTKWMSVPVAVQMNVSLHLTYKDVNAQPVQEFDPQYQII